ncbi:diguanylate cyclase (GGDEF)-like protein [Motilibacter rhizosphaerae]|uniref:Diguanylate cyclase (GGDEF)-like protein n=1 Tax=Motilibacter rhizosphaerae TaxID=598652 RepID=A0A4Q7NRS0_9ACTN|nr:GGDEF domain-containing protein [Motilibacter rhizosphaerae]RZS89793.1 diguanylate cyclase (GGDEF)-like protein [Motilibacter rhizosphaerae]
MPAAALDAAAAAVAALACLRAARIASARGARAWRCQAAACAAWACCAGVPALEVPGRLLFLLGVTCGMWLTSRASDVRSRLRMLLDGLTGGIGVAILLRTLVLDPAWHPSASPALVLWPAGAATLAVFYACIALSEIPPGRRTMPLLLVGALLCDATGACAESLEVLRGESGSPVPHLLRAACSTLVLASALVYRGTSRRREHRSSSLRVGLAPYALAAPASVSAVVRAASERLSCFEVGTTSCLVALVLLRQVVTLSENRELVARLAAREALLAHAATHDALTGLPGRGVLGERLAAALEAGGAAVLLVDLDGFKQVNDSLGHAVGDEVLVEAALRLTAAVPEPGVAGRLGGDEFAVVLPDPAQALPLVEVLVQRLADAYATSAGPVRGVSASIGLAVRDAPDGTTASQLMHEADLGMYAAKRAGKGRWSPAASAPRSGEQELPSEGRLRWRLDAGVLRVELVRDGGARLLGEEPWPPAARSAAAVPAVRGAASGHEG